MLQRDPLPRRTPRVLIRRLCAGDLPPFHASRADPELARYQGWSALTLAEAGAFIADMAAGPPLRSGDWVQWAIASAETNELIGDIGVFVHPPVGAPAHGAFTAEIGYTLARAAQGQGLATEAVGAALALLFECAPVGRVVATTDARNAASIRLLERVGMRLVRRDEGVFQGEACVELGFEISRPAAATP